MRGLGVDQGFGEINRVLDLSQCTQRALFLPPRSKASRIEVGFNGTIRSQSMTCATSAGYVHRAFENRGTCLDLLIRELGVRSKNEAGCLSIHLRCGLTRTKMTYRDPARQLRLACVGISQVLAAKVRSPNSSCKSRVPLYRFGRTKNAGILLENSPTTPLLKIYCWI